MSILDYLDTASFLVVISALLVGFYGTYCRNAYKKLLDMFYIVVTKWTTIKEV